MKSTQLTLIRHLLYTNCCLVIGDAKRTRSSVRKLFICMGSERDGQKQDGHLWLGLCSALAYSEKQVVVA